MLKEKRGEGLPFNIIIIAIIGIIVLFVIIFAFHKNTGDNINILNSCTGKGGKCMATLKECEDASGFEIAGENLCTDKDKKICCNTLTNENANKKP
jgi:hypothetical protein